ncbi:YgaP family membrane protein, partial [Vibrio cholerae]
NGVRVLAGSMVLLSVILTWFVHPNFLWLTVFVGVNLIQSAFTGFCPAAFFLKKLGLR